MVDILGLDSYVIGRPNKFSLTTSYDGYDPSGNKLFDVKWKLIGGKYLLIDSSGKTIGVMHKKMIAITPTYELYGGDGKTLIGKAVQEMNIASAALGGPRTFLLEDAQGNKLVHVQISSPLAQIFQGLEHGEGLEKSIVAGANMSYDVTSIDGTKTIAKIGIISQRNSGVNFGPNLASFVLNIMDKSVSTLALLEFVIAVDHLYTSAQMQPGNRFGNQLGGAGAGINTGGGFNIKM